MGAPDADREYSHGTITTVLVAVVAVGVTLPGTVAVAQTTTGADAATVSTPDTRTTLASTAAATASGGGPATGGPHSGSGAPTARVTTECLGDQTNRLHVTAENLSDENVTVVFDSANDSADFQRTVQPAPNGSVDTDFDVSDEYDRTVTVHRGDDTTGAVLASERFEAGSCDVMGGGPPLETARASAGCEAGARRLTLTNRNHDADLRVVVTDADGSEVLNTTIEAASTEVLEGLSNGTYTVVSRFDGEELGSENISVCCPLEPGDQPAEPGAGTATARVTTECLGDQTNRLHVTAENLSDENVTVVFDSANDSADFQRTVQPAANGSLDFEFDVSDEYDRTVTVHLGDDTTGTVLASERFEAGNCDVVDGTPAVEAARLETDCVDGDGALTLENRNRDADLGVVVTDASGTEVLNTTIEAASSETVEGLSDGTYTVVTSFSGAELGSVQVEVRCPSG